MIPREIIREIPKGSKDVKKDFTEYARCASFQLLNSSSAIIKGWAHSQEPRVSTKGDLEIAVSIDYVPAFAFITDSENIRAVVQPNTFRIPKGEEYLTDEFKMVVKKEYIWDKIPNRILYLIRRESLTQGETVLNFS